MWLVLFVLGFAGLGYFIKHGVINKERSTLERITYLWLALPVIWMYLLFGFIVLFVPVIAIMVLLEDIPQLGVFVLIGVILFILNVIKCVKKPEEQESVRYKSFADAVDKIKAKGKAEQKKTSAYRQRPPQVKQYKPAKDISFEEIARNTNFRNLKNL